MLKPDRDIRPFQDVLIERWLFFAEAIHTVTLYYRAEASALARVP